MSLATETSRSLEFWGDFYVTSHPDYKKKPPGQSKLLEI